jgi:hypothetical protein
MNDVTKECVARLLSLMKVRRNDYIKKRADRK